MYNDSTVSYFVPYTLIKHHVSNEHGKRVRRGDQTQNPSGTGVEPHDHATTPFYYNVEVVELLPRRQTISTLHPSLMGQHNRGQSKHTHTQPLCFFFFLLFLLTSPSLFLLFLALASLKARAARLCPGLVGPNFARAFRLENAFYSTDSTDTALFSSGGGRLLKERNDAARVHAK